MDAEHQTAAPAPEEFDGSALIGTTIAGRYEILKRIGRGGMGVVYLASQSNLSRKVVIKVLAPNLVDDKNAMARFEREARGLSRLQHPNIVTIFDFGRDGEQAYIAMEYVDGQTLSRHLRKTGPLRIDQFAPVAVQILKGLGEAHKLGLIHRDIKPTNIMLCELEGQPNFVKILDFGLAKLVRSPTEVTKEQHLVGSAAFLAPEQILNGVSNPGSDVYALGVLFYLMLSGKRPFKADNDAVLLYKHVNEDPPPLSRMLPEGHDIPPGIVRLVESCLRKDPEERPADANALLAAMSDCLATVHMPALPWMSGEFAAQSRSSVAHAVASTPLPDSNDPLKLNPNLALADDTLPPGYVSADTANPLHEISRSMGTQSVIMVAPESSKRTMIVTAVVVAVVVAVAVTVVLTVLNPAHDSQNQAEAATDVSQTTAVLDKVESLIDTQKWGRAEEMLDSVADDIARDSSLVERGADLRDQIATGRLMSTAGQRAQVGDLKGAINAYDEILARDPGHELAAAGKTEILARLQERSYGVLNVATSEDATVFIDGRKSGAAPIDVQLPPGTYSVRVVADGRTPWEKQVTVSEGDELHYDVDLVANTETATNTAPTPAPDAAAATPKTAPSRKKKSSRSKKRDDDPKPAAKTDPAAAETQAADEPKAADSATSDKRKKSDLLLPVGGSGSKKSDDDGDKKKGGDLLLPVNR